MEILFRGFREDSNGTKEITVNGKIIHGCWVYGDFIHDYGECGDAIRQATEYCGIFTIIPETVGQYTGLNDKNGKKIIVGDVVEYVNTTHNVVFEQRNGNGYFGITMSDIETWQFCTSVPSILMEVIGTIYDATEEGDNKK